MKLNFYIFPVFINLLFFISNADTMTNSMAGQMSQEESELTNSKLYNSADHASSPLGWLERDSSSLKIDLYYQFLKIKDFTGNTCKANDIVIPHFRVANPGILAFDLRYNPYIIKIDSQDETIKLPLHRFDLGFAAGTPGGIFQAGLKADLFVGKQTSNQNDDNRFIIGSEELSLHLGTRIRDFVQIGLYGGISGYFDSLCCQDTMFQDRFFSGTFPKFGGFIDVGNANSPIQSNFCLGFGFPKFVYVSKPSSRPFGNQNVIREDSLGWDWKTMFIIPAGKSNLKPALKIGYKKSTSQVYSPEEDNNPWQYKEKLSDSNWTTSSFGMGFGLAYEFINTMEMNLEYSFNSFSVENGPAYLMLDDKKDFYHSLVIGIRGNINTIPAFHIPESMNLTLKGEYFNFRHNQFIDTWKVNQFSYVAPINFNSQIGRYIPGNVFSYPRITGFNTVLGTSFFYNTIGIDSNIMFFRDGFEFGLNLWYNLQKSSDK